MRTFLAIALSLTLTTAVSYAFEPSPVDDDIAAEHISECLLEGDSKVSRRGAFVSCCSRAAGFCITCRENGAGKCTVRPAALIGNYTPVQDFIGEQVLTVPASTIGANAGPNVPARGLTTYMKVKSSR